MPLGGFSRGAHGGHPGHPGYTQAPLGTPRSRVHVLHRSGGLREAVGLSSRASRALAGS